MRGPDCSRLYGRARWPSGWLYYVGVDPDFRDRGYGAAIVAGGESWLQQRGIAKVMLMVRETNTVAEGFYHAIGYETAPRIVLQKWLKDTQ